MNEMRHLQRHGVTDQEIFEMNVVSFRRLAKNYLIAKLIDKSDQGVGIESPQKVDPGFVWFTEKLDGHRGGLLVWSKQQDTMYRAGIQFVRLSPDDEHTIEQDFDEQGRMKDPMVIANRMLESLKKSGGPVIIRSE